MRSRISILLPLALVVGCGGRVTEEHALRSGLPPSTPVSSLSTDQRGKLCDWMVGLHGGYDVTITCAEGSRYTVATRSECVANLVHVADCTVDDLERCALTSYPDPCTPHDSDRACAKVAACARP